MAADLLQGLQASLSGSYTIERELGGGGMSRVYIAEDVSLGRRIALKVLPPELAGPINADRFRREILLAARLQDPHIVPVLSAGQTQDGTPYYTMPLVDGESLRARLARGGALPIRDALRILRDVAKALAYAHELGVVHRDIKPDNVLLTRRDALVVDFGVAKALSSARDEAPNPTLTIAGTALGTPAYMAPEQVAADPNMDHRADLYAFGAMAYEMLAGRPPFVGSAPQRILAAHLSQQPEDVLNLRPDTPPALASLVMRCLAKEPSERPTTAAVLLEELDALITSGGYAAGPAIAEASRRSLGRALLLYAAAFAAVAILARAAVVGIGLPDWVFTGALVVMALGFPVVLFTGLVQHHSRLAHATGARTPGGSPTAASTMTQLSLKARPHITWRRTVLGSSLAMGIFVLVVVGYMAMRLLGIGPAGSLLAAGVLDQRAPVLVADFDNHTPDSLLGAVVTEAFRTDIAQSRALTTTQPVFVREALQRMQLDANVTLTSELARELATREGIQAVIEGDITPVGNGYLLAARVVAPVTGEVLAAFRETAASEDELIPAIDRLSKRVRERIGESLRSVRASPPLEQVTTRSLEALRKYTQALDPQTDWDRGVRLLEEAIVLDSTFAMAYRRLGTVLSNRGEITRAQPMIERAYAYRDRLPALERYLTEGSYWGTAMGDRERAIAAYEAALEVAPTNVVALNNVALLYATEGEFARGEQYLLRAIAADSNFLGGYANLVHAQVRLGKLREARQTLDRALARFPDSFDVLAVDVNLRFATGDTSARARARELGARARTPSDRLRAAEIDAAIALHDGRIAEYHRLRLQEAAARRARTTPALVELGRQADSLGVVAQVLRRPAAAGARAEALIRSNLFRSIPPAERPYLGAAQLFARFGRPAIARELLREREANTPPAQQAREREALPFVQALVAMAEGRHQEAVAHARATNSSCRTCLLPVLGQIYDSTGAKDSVVAVYERYISTIELQRSYSDGWVLAGIRERLGELYAERGNRERAIEHLSALVQQWEQADAELQPRVRAARAAIARLQRSG